MKRKSILKKSESRDVQVLANSLQEQVELKRQLEANKLQMKVATQTAKNLVDVGRDLALQYKNARKQSREAQRRVNNSLL